MRHRMFLLTSALALLTPTVGQASETLSYNYDARGRLIQVAHSGTVNNGVNTAYTLDKADNRTNRSTTGVAPPGPSFSVSDASVTEGGTLSFTVTRNGSASGNLTVDYATADGTAIAGSDYTAASDTLTFTPTDTSLPINVATIDDAAAENSETVLLNLSNASVGSNIADGQGIGTVADNEAVNQPPVAGPNGITVARNCTFSHEVLSNDTDPEGNYPLVLVSVSGGNGSGTVSGSQVTYTTDTTSHTVLTYTVADSLGASSTGSYTVNTSTTATCP